MNAEQRPPKTRIDTTSRVPPAPAEHEVTARGLALRRDVETLLEYLRDHKVTGTSSTGNLPLKAVAEIATIFVDPPVLEQRIGPYVHRFRSEEEVRPVYFAHLLARGADLVNGGPGRRWRLTEQGASFLTESAFGQVLTLLAGWWHRVDWQFLLNYRLFGEEHSSGLPRVVRSLIEQLPAGQAVDFEVFVDRLTEKAGWSRQKPEPYDVRGAIGAAVENMVIYPLAEFGIVATKSTRARQGSDEWSKPVSFSMTDFGKSLLQAFV